MIEIHTERRDIFDMLRHYGGCVREAVQMAPQERTVLLSGLILGEEYMGQLMAQWQRLRRLEERLTGSHEHKGQ